MSRIGKMPITLPSGVEFKIDGQKMIVKGPKGTLEQFFQPRVRFKEEDGIVRVEAYTEERQDRAFHGLYAKLLSNMVHGVSVGFKKTLVITGVGYRAEAKGQSLVFSLGYSTQIEYVLPLGIAARLESPTRVEISGSDKVLVGQVAAEIRSLRPPEPYKGKGIRYENEVVRRKVGKSNVKK